MAWKQAFFLVTIFGFTSGLSELENECITEYNKTLDNNLLVGTWYYVRHFYSVATLVPTTDCPIFTYEKPNATDLRRYEDEYSKPNAPFSVTDTPLHEDGGEFHPYGMLVGNKQAKFFIMDPNTYYYRPPFEVRIYDSINDHFVLYHECYSRGTWIWLMSRTRNPSSEDVDAAINSRPELLDLHPRVFCAES